MRLASTLCLATASVCALAAIWSPWHWQSAATAVLLVLIAAGIGGQRKPDDIEVHLHDFHGYSPEDVAAEIAKHQARSAAVRARSDEQHPDASPEGHGESERSTGRREFGKKADQ